jgi:adenylate cyclase
VALIRTKKLPKDADPKPYSTEELAKHLDPFLLSDLGRIQVDSFKKIQLTVVFWDIGGFSTLCNDLNDYPEAIIYFLNIYFGKAIKIINNNHGVLDKFIGDGILAYFGYNSRKGIGDPYNAIMAALEFKRNFLTLRNDFNKYCIEYNGKDASDVNLKCGMHNGPAFLHYFSTSTRNSVILMGSTVNFASRLQCIAKDDEIIVSRQLRNMVQGKFNFLKIPTDERVEEESSKGKIKSFEEEDIVYSIIGKK